jgi:signal transduction histidine kinase
MKRPSLAARIVIGVVGLDLLLVAALVMLGVFMARRELMTAFDASLQSKAMSIRALVRYDEDESEDLIFDSTGLPASADPAHPDVFAVYLKGNLLARSPGWNGLPQQTRHLNGEFARFAKQGTPFRGIMLRDIEILDREEDMTGPVARITVIYGSSLLAVRRRVLRVGLYLGGCGLILLIPMLWLTMWAVRRGLSPLHDLAGRAAKINVGNWNFYPPANVNLTPELAPLTDALQTLLARLRESFARQREFTSDLAHELKTSVAILKSGAQVSLQNPHTAMEYRAEIENLLTDCERLETLIERMLRLARVEQSAEEGARGSLEATDLFATCETAVGRVAPLAATKQVCVALDGNSRAQLRANPEDLELVWVNLLDNAVRHSPAGSTVTLRVEADANGRTNLSVNDSGTGIAAADLPHIFERFHRGSNPRGPDGGGFGLGLAICKAIVEAYGGSIRIEGATGGGTRVLVELPTAAPAT